MEFSCNPAPKRQRHPKPSDKVNDRICTVCGDKADNFNFGQITCESCKAFFRRNVGKDKSKEWKCINNGSCLITRESRKRCSSCRLNKCFEAGMDPLLIKINISSSGKSKQYSPRSENSSNSLDITGPSSKSSDESFDNSFEPSTIGQVQANYDVPHQFIIPFDNREFPYISAPLLQSMQDRIEEFNSAAILPRLVMFLQMDRKSWLNNNRMSPYSDLLIEQKLCDLKEIVETKLKVNMSSIQSISPDVFQSSCSWLQIVNLLEVFVRYSVSAVTQLYEFKHLEFEDKIFLLKERMPSIILPTYFASYRPESRDFLFTINNVEYPVNPMSQIEEICSADTPFSCVRDYLLIIDLLYNLTGGSLDLGFAYVTIKLFLVDPLKFKDPTNNDVKCSQFLRTLAQENAERYIILLYQGLAKYYPHDCDIRFEGILKLLSFSEKFDQILSMGLSMNTHASSSVPPIMKEILGASLAVTE